MALCTLETLQWQPYPQIIEVALQLALSARQPLVLDGQIGQLFVRIAELLLGLPARPVRLLQHRLRLLERVLHGMRATLRIEHVVPGAVLGQLLGLKLECFVPDSVLK